MNVLFCNTSDVSELKGGTERITARISEGLIAMGYKCFLAYKEEIDSELPHAVFEDKINVTKDSLEVFLLKYRFGVIIVQKMTRDVRLLINIRAKYHLQYKVISVLHFNPGYEEYKLQFSSFLRDLWQEGGVKNFIRTALYPIYKVCYPLRNKELYRTVYRYSDRMVLLSANIIPEYQRYAHLGNESEKFVIIPNALSFNDFLPFNYISRKKKQVLIVSRLDERLKRLSLAIKIWAMIERVECLSDWSLKIVGTGPYLEKYRKLITKQHLCRIELCGRQNPLSYYQESAVFMMTSAFEGWGLTLTEAQQMGCVPVAFHSFAALTDIITNGENGIIVKNNDLQGFANQVAILMTNETLRIHMAQKAIDSSKRYQLDTIISQWVKLINER